jgi:catechol 2,3-dioxygenase-like lactoylglutathione lyase family enzyme
MKRFHVHLAVADLDANIRFYSSVFGAQPTVRKADYAKWMLDDPRINFALSSRGEAAGVNHLGFQVESDDELQTLRKQVEQADLAALDQPGAACCYARSDKYWVTDPQGIAWETFHTLDSIPVFGGDTATSPEAAGAPAAGCCVPETKVSAKIPVNIPVRGASSGKCC